MFRVKQWLAVLILVLLISVHQCILAHTPGLCIVKTVNQSYAEVAIF